MEITLLVSVFVVAACGLVYELTAGALASYLLGDSVLQFSTIIGSYLFAMGIGSWLSRFLDRQLAAHFLRIELLVALAGGFMPALLFVANAYIPNAFRGLVYAMVVVVGILVGLEIPLVMRILKREITLKNLVSQVLTFDYLGALAVSVAFPLVLIPQLGLVRTGLFFGLLNAAVAVWTLWIFRHELRRFTAHAIACAVSIAALLVGLGLADRITTLAEDKLYHERVVLSETSSYQRIIVTAGKVGYKLFLNGNLQFAERDEYRYHEALVHPAMSAYGAPRKVAVLGGGDGMAVREILKYPSVESVTLVELDPHMTEMFAHNPAMVRLNANALNSPKLHILNQDAFGWLQENSAQLNDTFDVIIVDFPDPTNFSIGKLYTNSFYSLLAQRLSASGYAVIQTTSPLVARKSFWTVAATIESVGLKVTPYHVNVPSFGEWGYIVASHRPWHAPSTLPGGLRFLNMATLHTLFDFPSDMTRVPAEINRLSNQVLVSTYEQEWGRVGQ